MLERGQVRGERGRLRLCRGVQAGAGRRVWRGGGGPAPDPQGTRAEGRRGAGLLRRGGWPDRAPGEGRQVARAGQQLCPPRQLHTQQLARCVHVQSTCSAALPSMLPSAYQTQQAAEMLRGVFLSVYVYSSYSYFNLPPILLAAPTTSTVPPQQPNPFASFGIPSPPSQQNQSQQPTGMGAFGAMGGVPDMSQMQSQMMQNPEMV